MKLTPVGIDIAKSVFQVHYVDLKTGEEVNKTLRRDGFWRILPIARDGGLWRVASLGAGIDGAGA